MKQTKDQEHSCSSTVWFRALLCESVGWYLNPKHILYSLSTLIFPRYTIHRLLGCCCSSNSNSNNNNKGILYPRNCVNIATSSCCPDKNSRTDTTSIRVNDLNMVVMQSLGVQYQIGCSDDDNHHHQVASCDVEALFSKEEPSIGEIREVFRVFDVDKDGLIDPMDLCTILSRLGLMINTTTNTHFDVEACRTMLRRFDKNGAGVLDFHGFLKFMERYCFC